MVEGQFFAAGIEPLVEFGLVFPLLAFHFTPQFVLPGDHVHLPGKFDGQGQVGVQLLQVGGGGAPGVEFFGQVEGFQEGFERFGSAADGSILEGEDEEIRQHVSAQLVGHLAVEDEAPLASGQLAYARYGCVAFFNAGFQFTHPVPGQGVEVVEELGFGPAGSIAPGGGDGVHHRFLVGG